MKSKHLPNNELLVIDLIMKAVGNEALTIIDLNGITKNVAAPQNEDNKSEIKKSETSEHIRETSKGFGISSVVEVEK